jgi:hypothetical protein
MDLLYQQGYKLITNITLSVPVRSIVKSQNIVWSQNRENIVEAQNRTSQPFANSYFIITDKILKCKNMKFGFLAINKIENANNCFFVLNLRSKKSDDKCIHDGISLQTKSKTRETKRVKEKIIVVNGM